MHGPLDTPMVSTQVYANRRYHGPPRNESEQIAQAAAMASMRRFVAESALDNSAASASPTDLSKRPHNSCAVDSVSSDEADSDDEDSCGLDPQPTCTSLSPAGVHREAHQHAPLLEQELDRLVAAFEGAADSSDTW